MTNPFVKRIKRGADKELLLFSQNELNYSVFDGLPPVSGNSTHFRFHPTRSEWVGYSTARQNRTFLPDALECPLCPMQDEKKQSDIPVDKYEVAIFTNRFSSLQLQASEPPSIEIDTNHATGTCDVVSYSSNHLDQFSQLSLERINLIIQALSYRTKELFNKSEIKYVLPFENKGKEIGVTLDHPHGQIYSFGHIPEAIKKQSQTQQSNPLEKYISKIPEDLILKKNNNGISFVPRWARYPFEIWIVPNRRVSNLFDLSDEEQKDIAELMLDASKKLDSLFDSPMPYTLAWQISPKGYEETHHLHICFQPIRRSKTKLKFLAGVEQITGFYLVDLPPERSARILRGEEQPDE
ncbi:galactose-1-phosphate uridylyltransferase [Alphaproteobacteria bacterium]|nr:galactose-1-phosphate uridylyltransferase [Alphaproteobacteria bacterium]